jgi:putative hydrolase of the HAD superfamily
VSRPYRVILFDMFGTVVRFVPPSGAGFQAFEWLRAPLTAVRPAIAFDDFRVALLEVSAAIRAAREPEHHEVPSRERFRRALARFDVAGPSLADSAEALSRAHMAHLAAQTEMPRAHPELLAQLAARYRLGLISNFDHAPTARAILARYDVHHCFDVTLISDDFGRRKPHPAIFHAALRHFGAAPAEALYVGDSATDDVVGAQAAGVDVAWLNGYEDEPPDPPPTHTLRALTELRKVLG